MAGLSFYINLDEGDPAKALVSSFADDSPLTEPPKWARSDSKPVKLMFLRRTQDVNAPFPFYFVDPSTFTSTKFAGGVIGSSPDGGTFTLTGSSGGTTSALAFNAASTTTVQTQVRTLTNLSAATVTGNAGGPYSIDSNSTANGTLAITGSAAALAPDGSTVVIEKTQTANGSLTNRWIITLAKALPILKASGWSALPAALVTPSVVQAGSSTAHKTFRVVWNADAVGGAVVLTFTGDTVTETLKPIPFNANADDVANIFFAHTDVGNDGVAVVRNGPGDFTITCVGTGIAFTNVPALATGSNTLVVPLGLTAVVQVSTAGADAILGSDDEADITIEIEIQESSGAPNTCVQTPATLLKDLILNTPGQATGTENWITEDSIRQGQTLRVDSVYGNDAAGAREHPEDKPFLSLAAASAAAFAGDLVRVGPGIYTVTGSVAKDGVDWYFEEGATVTMNMDLVTGAFDDGGTIMSFNVDGYGDFSQTAQAPASTDFVAIVASRNAGSDIHFRCRSLRAEQAVGGSDSSGCAIVQGGSLVLDADNITGVSSAYGLYWENGDFKTNVRKLSSDTIGSISTAGGSAPTGKFWVNAVEITGDGDGGCINTSDANTSLQIWVVATEIRANGANGNAVSHNGTSKLYVTAQKIIGGTGAIAVNCTGGGQLWARAEKISAGATIVACTSGTLHCSALHWEEADATTTSGFTVAGGTLNITGGLLTLTAGNGITISSGTGRFTGVTINTTASNAKNPVTKSGGTLILDRCVLVAESTRDSITAGTSQTVVNYASKANKAKNVNITVTVDALTVDAAVV